MKKYLILLLCMIVCVSCLCSCGSDKSNKSDGKIKKNISEESEENSDSGNESNKAGSDNKKQKKDDTEGENSAAHYQYNGTLQLDEVSDVDKNESQADNNDDIEQNEKESVTFKLSIDEAKKAADEITDSLFFWTYEYLYCENEESDGTIDFRHNDFQRAKASSVAVDLEECERIPSDDDLIELYLIDENYIQNASKNLFGVESNTGALREDDWYVRRMEYNQKMSIVFELSLYEDEGVYDVRDEDFEQTDIGYTLTQEIYCGYWGYDDGILANFRLIFNFEENDLSEYGLVLTEMTYEMLYDITDYSDWEPSEYELMGTYTTPFYGIWCSASKNQSDAEVVAQAIYNQGLLAKVYVSSDWTNLNSEKYYVVTAGEYYSEEFAKADLELVKKLGYPSAYVKYTGDYKY